MAYVGSWEWSRQTNGALRARDRLTLVRQAVAAQADRLPAPWRRAAAGVEIPDPPDSKLAREATACCEELSSQGLVFHCLRSWAFSALLGQAQEVEHDAELLYVACLLHDLGLTEAHDRKDPAAECFGVEGGRAAHEFVSSHNGGAAAAETVAEAITLHLNITVPERFGPVAALANRGIWLDVVGRRSWLIPEARLREVIDRWGREDIDELFEGSRHQAQARPRSRSAFMEGLPGSDRIVAANPLNSL